MAIIQEFDLNMIPESAPVVVKVNQYDEGTGRLVISLYDGETTYTPASGATVMIQGTKPDLHAFSYDASLSGNVVTADLTQQMTAVAGRTRVQVIVNESANRTGTFVFWLDVQMSALQDDAIISDTEVGDLIDLARTNANIAVNAAANAVSAANTAVSAVANISGYANTAVNAANNAAASANTASNAATVATEAVSSAENSANAAGNYANSAANSAAIVVDYSDSSEAWAVGQRGGVNVSSEDETYHNNSKYWAEQAQQAAIGVEFDDVPINGSINAVYSNGIYSSVVANTDLIKDTVGWSGKNLLPYPYSDGTSKTTNGITFTVDSTTGAITASGTATDNANFKVVSYTSGYSLPAGEYILTGCPSGGSDGNSTSYFLRADFYVSDVYSIMEDTGTGARKTYSDTIDLGTTGHIYIRINSGVTVDNVVFYPMLRKASILDDTYEPYHKTVAELLESIPTTLDDSVTQNSSNPVKSSGIYSALSAKQNTITFDSTPISGSSNAVTSGGVYAAIQNGGGGSVTVDSALSNTSTNAVQNRIIYNTLYGNNVLFGENAGVDNSSANNAVAIGVNAVANGSYAVAIGRAADGEGYSVAEGMGAKANSHSVAIGYSARANNIYTVAIGNYTNATANYSTAIGIQCKATADFTFAAGHNAAASEVNSVSIGKNSYAGGLNSIAIGLNSGSQVNSVDTVAIGYTAMAYNKASVALGGEAKALANYATALGDSSYASGINCTAVGFGAHAQGNYSAAFGAMSSVNGNNSVAIGSNVSVTLSNCVQLGDSNITSLRCAVTTITTSDERDKADIEDLSTSLDFINSLRPVTYVRNAREQYAYPDEKLSKEELEKRYTYGLYGYDKKAHKKGTKKGTRRRVGLIAQEVRQAIADAYGNDSYMNIIDDDLYNFKDVPEDVEGRLGISYANLIPVLVKAIQELSAKIKELEGK